MNKQLIVKSQDLEQVNKEIVDLWHRWLIKEISSKSYDIQNEELFNRGRRVVADIQMILDEEIDKRNTIFISSYY